MKITILFLALIALGFSVKAQRMALADNKTHGTTAASTSLLYRRKLLNLYSPIMGST